MNDRLAELREMQDDISAAIRDACIGEVLTVLVDEPGVARSSAEAPEIDGIIYVDEALAVGEFHNVLVTDAQGPDLFAELLPQQADQHAQASPAAQLPDIKRE
jgi:ribosomal protein S12 methylthiotransferase